MKRTKLPNERKGITHRFVIKSKDPKTGEPLDIKGYITANRYPEGHLGEVFLKMDQQGSQVSGFCDAFAISVSMLLQLGMSAEEICRKFRSTRFEPAGVTDNPNIRFALSPIDYMMRWLESSFVDTELHQDS